MRYFGLILFSGVFSLQTLPAQSGCTDPQAVNYDPGATNNDGSCVYPVAQYALTVKTELPAPFDETSGIVIARGAAWTHNDSGSDPKIYKLDTLTGAIIQTITVGGAANVDWEDIASDGDHLYIGDFGNNANGNRTDLKIYKIPLSAVPAGDEVTVPSAAVAVINFSYADQSDFTPQGPNNTRFDCEALFWQNDTLHLFTKNWVDYQTTHYAIPAAAGTYVAAKRETFLVNGLITAADISNWGVVTLLGYHPSGGVAFLWLVSDYPGSNFFSGNNRRIELGSLLLNGQVEGICFRDDASGYITNERVSVLIPPRMYRFQVSQWLQDQFLPAAEPSFDERKPCAVRPNPLPAGQPINLPELTGNTLVRLSDAGGRLVWQGSGLEWKPLRLPVGTYWLSMQSGPGDTCAARIVIR